MTGATALSVQESFDDYLARQDPRARGETFNETLDKARLDRQAKALARILKCDSGECSGWYTLEELKACGMLCSITSISARLRDLRRFLQETANGQIQTQARPNAPRGVFESRFNPDHTAPIRP